MPIFWNPNLVNFCGISGDFESDINFSEFDRTENFDDNESGYKNAKITLPKLAAGNTSSSPIDQSTFFNK